MKGLDTNVLVRYLVQDDPEQSRKAAHYIESNQSFINDVVLCELVWVLESAYGYRKHEIADTLEKILLTSEFEIENRDLAWAALGDYRNSKTDFSDCLVGRKNAEAGCEETLSFDKSVKGLRGFKLLQ